MPRAYFEPESLDALAEVFAEAKRRLNVQDINDPTTLDIIASHILRLAADGHAPSMILGEILGQAQATGSTIQQNGSSSQPSESRSETGG